MENTIQFLWDTPLRVVVCEEAQAAVSIALQDSEGHRKERHRVLTLL